MRKLKYAKNVDTMQVQFLCTLLVFRVNREEDDVREVTDTKQRQHVYDKKVTMRSLQNVLVYEEILHTLSDQTSQMP